MKDTNDSPASTAHHVHHGLDYVELTVTDMAAAQAFYSGAFGWSFVDHGPDYTAIRSPSGVGEVGGLARGASAQPGGPLVLLWSEDLDATVTAVEAAGGHIVEPPYDFPGGRRFHFADPAGNRLGVWTSTRH